MQKTKKTMAGLLAATVLLGATSVLQAIQIEPVSAASDPVKIMAMGDSITWIYQWRQRLSKVFLLRLAAKRHY